MLDTGANCSAVTEDICDAIGAKISNLEIELAVFGHESTKSGAVTSVSVYSLNQNFHIDLNKCPEAQQCVLKQIFEHFF